jgi:hypothetical protein
MPREQIELKKLSALSRVRLRATPLAFVAVSDPG